MAKQKTNNAILFAVDIETGGQLVGKTPIVAIGWCCGDLQGKVYQKARVSLEVEKDLEFEQECLQQFWYASPVQQAQLEAYRAEAIPIKQGLTIFLQELAKAEALAAASQLKFFKVSDNPAFDFGFINYYLSRYLNHLPLSHRLSDRRYEGQLCDEWGVLRKCTDKKFTVRPELVDLAERTAKSRVLHDHWPENDAHYIYSKTIALVEACKVT